MQKAATEICDNNMTPRYKLGQRWRQTDSTDLLGGASAGSTFGSIMASFFPRLTKERGVWGGRKVFEKSRLVLSRNLSNQNKFATPRSSSLTMSSGWSHRQAEHQRAVIYRFFWLYFFATCLLKKWHRHCCATSVIYIYAALLKVNGHTIYIFA